MFTRVLAERLGAVAHVRVSEAADGGPFTAGRVWIASGGRHLEVRRVDGEVVMRTHAGPEENSCRPAADVLFRSASEAYGSGVLAVVLSGMGRDGLRGSESIRARGGRVLVQDEATSVVWGMPGAVFRAGLAEGAFPLDDIGAEIARRVLSGRQVAGR
jgi:two-component system chemotaxis response regulator CheB